MKFTDDYWEGYVEAINDIQEIIQAKSNGDLLGTMVIELVESAYLAALDERDKEAGKDGKSSE